MLDVRELKLANVLDITVANLWGGIGLVLVENAFSVPLLDHAGDGDDTTGAVLAFELVGCLSRLQGSGSRNLPCPGYSGSILDDFACHE